MIDCGKCTWNHSSWYWVQVNTNHCEAQDLYSLSYSCSIWAMWNLLWQLSAEPWKSITLPLVSAEKLFNRCQGTVLSQLKSVSFSFKLWFPSNFSSQDTRTPIENNSDHHRHDYFHCFALPVGLRWMDYSSCTYYRLLSRLRRAARQGQANQLPFGWKTRRARLVPQSHPCSCQLVSVLNFSIINLRDYSLENLPLFAAVVILNKMYNGPNIDTLAQVFLTEMYAAWISQYLHSSTWELVFASLLRIGSPIEVWSWT